MTRGIEFSALMYGSKMAPATGESASHMPMIKPPIVPDTNASTVSSNVTHRCA